MLNSGDDRCVRSARASPPALLPATTFTTSCVRSTRDRPFPSLSPLLLPPRAPSASPASTILPDPHAPRTHPHTTRTTTRVRSTCGSRSVSPAPQLSPPRPPPPCLAPHYFARSQLLSGTGSKTPSIAGTRSKCNERSPSPSPPSSPPRGPRPSSAPMPPSAPNLGLSRTANATDITPCVRSTRCGRPPSSRTLPASHVHPQRRIAPLVDDSAAPPPMCSMPCGGFPSPAPAVFAAMTRRRASSGRPTRR
ncbi:hypothetical protein DFH09DRAFT_1120936 [Mycena vulgaris]|nr:hypothetical protein DFH09DRAFT_1120936 [Mycena vulgaris]